MTSIQLNGEPREFDRGLTVLQLLQELGVPVETVLVECNREVLPRAQFETRPIEDGDVIELVRFVGGG